MKRFFIILFFIILLLSMSITSFASNHSVYGSVTDSSSQVNILIKYYMNMPDFDFNDEYVIFRAGQYDYRLYYSDSLSNNIVNYIRYSTYDNTYNSQYYITTGTESNFSYSSNNYTVVGNVYNSLGSYEFINLFNDYKIYSFIIILAILITFSIFRSSFKEWI